MRAAIEARHLAFVEFLPRYFNNRHDKRLSGQHWEFVSPGAVEVPSLPEQAKRDHHPGEKVTNS